ncbi:MAG TPA: D-hexose-6-phosphate mutarotase [Spongiibacteraceae bacterium]|jgi:glucose-6-phosphate 1-epimerase
MQHTLATTQATLNQVTLEQRDELPLLRINNHHADALIALQGAQVLEFTPRGTQPIIWLSEQAEYKRGQGQRGGIPICWPWFGALARNPAAVTGMVRGDDAPAHGLVRTEDWTLHSIIEHDDYTTVTLRYITSSALQTRWPHSAELQLQITIGKSLTLKLTTRNLSAQPLALTQALHSYFAISAIDNVHITGFENSRYIDTLDEWREHPQHDAIRFHGETDRIYLDVPASVQLHDTGWQRTIHLRASNSASAIVWNPGIEKSKRLSQFAPDAWRNMVCIETANVLDDMVLLPAGAERELTLEITSISALTTDGANKNSGT